MHRQLLFFIVLVLGWAFGVAAQESTNQDMSNAEQDRQALIELVEQLKQENTDLHAALSQQDRLAQELKSAHDSAIALEAQRQELSGQRDALESELNDARSEIDGLRGELAGLRSTHESATAHLAELEQTRETLQAQITERDEQLNERAQELAALVEEIELARAMISERDADIAALQLQVEQTQDSLESTNRQAASLSNDLDIVRGQLAGTRSSLDQSARVVQRFRAMLKSARTNSQALNEEIATVRQHQADMQNQHEAELNQARENLATLGTKLRDTRSERDSLVQALEKYKTIDYVVKNGDSLSRIAKTIYGDTEKWNTIYEANLHLMRNPRDLVPGMTITIPKN